MSLAGCGGSDGNDPGGGVASVEVTPASSDVPVGGTVQLTATARDADGNALTGRSASWSSSDPAVATVDAGSGLVTGVAPGTVSITATIDDVDATASVGVNLPVESVTIEPAEASVAVGGSLQLTATPRDGNGDPIAGLTPAWSSSDDGVATVSPAGMVSGVALGEATITATIQGESGTAIVTVSATSVATVEVEPAAVTLHQGTAVQLTAVAKDAQGDVLLGRVAAWSTDNNVVASVVPATGLVSAQEQGTATITATIEGVAGTSAITVNEPGFVTISTGSDVSCGITTVGETVCWGFNLTGALGNEGATASETQPAPVSGGHDFAAIFSGLGPSHVCAVTTADAGFCWGANAAGEVGIGSGLGIINTPTEVSGGIDFVSIRAGNASGCGAADNGNAFCWGTMDAGLGDMAGTTTSTTPIQVGVVNTFAQVEAANNFACGLTLDSKVYCWGANDQGQLGRGNQDPSPTPVEVSGGRTYVALSARHQHACAIASGGAAYCWGPNDNAQGGTGGQGGNSIAPTPVTGGHTFASISVGQLHTCGVTTAGEAYCWGDNSNGQLGDNTEELRNSPVLVSGAHVFAEISAGGFRTCGVTTGGDGYCWGVGFLGDGSEGVSRVPVLVRLE